MKPFLLILIFFVSIALSIPNNNQHLKEILHFNRPINSDIYQINSTQTVIFDISNYSYFGMQQIISIFNVNTTKINLILNFYFSQR